MSSHIYDQKHPHACIYVCVCVCVSVLSHLVDHPFNAC